MAVQDTLPQIVIKNVAEELKKNPTIKPPEWVFVVKSGTSKERIPEQPDFWYLRCASLLRTLYVHGTRGVQKLRHKYGGRKEHTVSRPHHWKGGGKIIRVALQQLEQAGYVEKENKVGRHLTKLGQSLIDKLSKNN